MKLILSFALSLAIFTVLHADTETTAERNSTIISDNILNETEPTISTYEAITRKTHDHTDHEDFEPKHAGKWSIPRPDLSGCDKDFSCIRYRTHKAKECTGPDCQYMLAYRLLSDGEVELLLAARQAQYVAVGFTPDPNKVDPRCIVCTRTKNNTVALSLMTTSWIGFTFTDIPSLNNDAMEMLNSDVENDGLWCLIRLSAFDNVAVNIKDTLRQIYFWGEIDESGKPNLVGKNEKQPENFYASQFPLSFETKIKSEGFIRNRELELADVDCSVFNCAGIGLNDNMGSKCDYKSCSYLLAYEPIDQPSLVWSVILSSTNAQFVAVGFTEDLQSRSNTEVMGCKKNKDGKVEAFNFWFSSPAQKEEPQKIYGTIKVRRIGITEKGIWCYLERPVEPGENAFSLKNPVYLLYMWGSLETNGEPNIWDPKKNFTSTEKMNLSKAGHWTSFDTMSGSSANTYTVGWILFIVVIMLTLS